MKKFIKIPIYVIVILLLGMLSGHFTFKLLSFGRTVDAPDLRGKGMIEANAILKSKGLYIRLEGEDYDSHVPQGYIIRQDVPPGNAVKEGREIGVVLSRGQRVRYIPDIIGQPLSEAEAMLNEMGIKIEKIIYVHSDAVDKNIILAQRPDINEKGSEAFSVIVSLGSHNQEGK
ncbi:MAG: PASTA domain-containing protein [Thermodesulfovibrionales bacterium]|nr:PASTA domain-containing protein [Thermodesulfovibrionales bacterium]